jgi:hypothetical protein
MPRDYLSSGDLVREPFDAAEFVATAQRVKRRLRWSRRGVVVLFVSALPLYLLVFHLVSPSAAGWAVAALLIPYAVLHLSMRVIRCPACRRFLYDMWGKGLPEHCRRCGVPLNR